MSYRPVSSPTWYQALGSWILGDSRKKRDFEEGPPESANVEFLETRQLLTAVVGASSPEKQAADTSSSTVTNADGSSTTTSVSTTTNADGSVTTVTTTTTTKTDGTVATSSSTVTTPATNTKPVTADSDEALGSAVQSDGKIILVGYAQTTTSDAEDANNFDFAVTRLNADGSLDTTFGTNGKKTISFDLGGNDRNQDVATCVKIQPDGKIVIGGYAQRSTGNFDYAIVRLNTDGSLDTTFSNDGKATVAFDFGGSGNDRATSMVIQPDGKIILAGFSQSSGAGNNFMSIARLTTDGELDESFTGDGRKFIYFNAGDDRAAGVALQSDGKIVIVGSGTGKGTGSDMAIARLKTNGSLDYSFSGDGKKMVGFDLGGTMQDKATSVAIQSDGSILLGGSAEQKTGDLDFAVARLKSNGSMDKSFGSGGRKTVSYNLGGGNNDQISAMALQSDGKIVVGGFTQISLTGDYDFALARLNVDGSLDTSFSSDGRKTVPFNVGDNDGDLGNTLNIQSDGKILMAGSAMKSSNVNSDFAITRLNDDGELDNSFGTNGIKLIPFDLT
jgi:uncharacterized delta-60 repeat protein